MAAPVEIRLSRGLLLAVVGSGALVGFSLACGPRPAAADKPGRTIDPTSANAACYVCHMTFVREELSKVHFQEKVTCIECHGLSAAHANDEDVGATKPDVVFTRQQVDPMCIRCHESHDAPARQVVARFLQRQLPLQPAPVCTDCHGRHKIEEPADEQQQECTSAVQPPPRPAPFRRLTPRTPPRTAIAAPATPP